MVINTNMTGASGTPLAKTNTQQTSDSKSVGASAKPSTPAAMASDIDRIFANGGSPIEVSDTAGKSAFQLASASMLSRPATALLAQGNLSPETVYNLLQA